MKVLVTGVTGQLGYDVVRVLRGRGVEVVGATRSEMPLDDPGKARAFVEVTRPDAVIHCAAYTAVDRAEEERELCLTVNAESTRAIAGACEKIGAKLVYISTDYVFPGTGERFCETGDETAPCNAYGASKLAGEDAVRDTMGSGRFFIVRVSWVFGVHGRNFIRTILGLAKTRDALTVVDDQVGSPTYTADLAELLADMAESEKFGVYHATNEGVCSWAELASEVIRLRGLKTKVTPVSSEMYPTKATRPKNSRLSKSSLDAAGFRRLPDWKDAVKRYLAELEAIGE
jgi:dTDP-4-dehydrorhamnose reductase